MKWMMSTVLCFLLLSSQSLAYQAQRLTAQQGLPGDKVITVLRDSDDFLWVATEQGVVRYDGYNFSPFPKNQVLRDNLQDVSAFFIDADNRHWLGTTGGLYLIQADGQSFQRFRHVDSDESSLSSNMIIKIYQDNQANIWVATYNGLNRYIPQTGQFERFNLAKTYTNLRFVNVIIDVIDIGNNKLWLATTQGIYEVNLSDKHITPVVIERSDNIVLNPGSFLYDNLGQLWIGTGAGLIKYGGAGQLSNRYLANLSNPRHPANRVHSMVQVNEQNLWLSTDDGVYEFNIKEGRFNRLSILNDFSDKYIGDLIKDDSGLVWIATFAGLIKVTPTSIEVKKIESADSAVIDFSDKGVLSTYEKSLQQLFVGTWGDGLYMVNTVTHQSQNYRYDPANKMGINSNAVWSIFEDDGGLIWLGTGNGISIFDTINKTFKHRDNDPNFPLKAITTTVLSIDKSESGQFWISTGLGLYHYDPTSGEVKHYITDDEGSSLSHNVIRKVLQDSQGNTWIATRNGLNRYNGADDSFTRFYPNDYRDGIQSNSIIGLAQLMPGKLLVAMVNEVYLFDVASGKSERFQLKDGRLGVLDLLVEDSQNDVLWLFGNAFAGYWDRQSKSLRNLSHINDLRRTDYIEYSATVGLSGQIYLGSYDGLGYFTAQKQQPREFAPKVRFADLLIDDKSIAKQSLSNHSQITLTSDQRQLSFDMASLDYFNSPNNRYRYQLDTMDESWQIRDADRRFVSLSNLAPGTHQLRVQGSNSDGVWSPLERKLQIIVLPAVWQTWWAKISFIIVFISLVFLLVRYRTARIRRHSKELAQQVKERTVEISEQKQTIESLLAKKDEFFANVSHEFRTPLALILGPIESVLNVSGTHLKRTHVHLIQRNAKRLLRMVDQLLAFSRLDAPAESSAKITSLSQLLPVLVQSFEPLAQKQQITFEYKAAVDKLWVAVETEVLEKVILNLLSNAFKYTPNGGQVSCELSLSDAGQITFSVSDSGIGIDPQYHQQVFERFGRLTPLHHEDVPGAGIGLALVKSLLDACGGQISLQSEAGKGAIFTVSFSRFEPDDNVEQLMDETLHISSDLTLELDGLEVVEQAAQIVDVIDEHRPTLLVIEDNTDMRNYICESLNDSYQCLSAVNGSVGLARAQADIPDLIISDIMMPELDGYSLSKALKEDDKTSHIPVILLTALSDKDSRKKGWQQQADDYLTKPFDVEELKLRIDNLLTLRNMLKQRFGETLFVEQPKAAITELAKGEGLSAKDQTFLDKLENVMAEHYHDHELSVGVLGSHVAMAERQLRRKLKALLNHAPSEYIRVYRLKKAAEKMVAGEQIQLAALNAGFASYSTFIASFKARYGMSPREYLQQTQAQGNQ